MSEMNPKLKEALRQIGEDFRRMSDAELRKELADHTALLKAEGRKPIFEELYDFSQWLNTPEGIAAQDRIISEETQYEKCACLNA